MMNRKINYILLGLVIWFLLFLGWEWWKSYPLVKWNGATFPQTKEEKIDSLMLQSLQTFRLPGLVLGIVENEKLIFLKSLGFADLKTKDSLKTSTPFPLASISKLATALTASSYFRSQEIPLESTVNSILPEGKKLSAEFESITLADLLNHTSGLKDPKRLEQLFIQSENRILRNLPDHLPIPELDKKPKNYADINYDLLGFVIESHAGIEFDQLAKEKILKPSGMNGTEFNRTIHPSDHTPLKSYQPTFIWKRLEEKKTRFERFPSPSSGLISTGIDLGNAMIHFSRWDMGFIHKELEFLSGNQGVPSGFQEIQLSGYTFWGHFGEQGGYNGLFFFSKELDRGIFLLTNSRDVKDHRFKIAEGVISILLSNP
uniref:serine hydrolase domain-containing protein n=1 Tax=Algoriphagus sp. TaxID=1872435 RepID=UPI002584A887|nr:serine hydrolase domain-containing protein [Algoriphagus sp.]